MPFSKKTFNKVPLIREIPELCQSLEQLIVDTVYDRRDGPLVNTLKFILKIASYIFQGIVQLRYFFYKHGIFRSHPLGCLVVIVGNLTVGGTGKTPVVEKLARTLKEKGRKVAILSRGYKSKPIPAYKKIWWSLTHKEAPAPKVVSDGKTVFLDSEEAGDEPYMLAKNLPGVMVFVDKNRVNAGKYAIKHYGADTLILDDGFQYLPLKGRLNLLLIDKTNPFGNGYLLPRGILREPIRHLKRASYIFLTKSDGQKDEALDSLIRRHKPSAEIIECSHHPRYLQAVWGSEVHQLPFLKDKPIAVLSAIAAPDSFESFLTQSGARLVHKKRYIDHHRFTTEELNDFFEKAKHKGAEAVITTEKDAVRIPQHSEFPLPFYYLRLEIDILSGNQDFEEAVGRICFPQQFSQ